MSGQSSTRTCVYYRFTHETDESFKILEFDSDKITVPDLKILIAKATGLEKEFARKFDLKLSLLSLGSSGFASGSLWQEEHVSDTQFIYPESRLVVQRTAWHERPSIQHVAKTTLPRDAWTEKKETSTEEKRPFPPEFICPLCSYVLDHPVVVRCPSKCGRSACRKCIEDRFKEKRICPFCQNHVQNVIANKALTALIGQLNLEEFANVPIRLPGIKQPTITKPEPNMSSDLEQQSVLPSTNSPGVTSSDSTFYDPKVEPKSERYQKISPGRISSIPKCTTGSSLLENPLLKNLAAALSTKRPTSTTETLSSRMLSPEMPMLCHKITTSNPEIVPHITTGTDTNSCRITSEVLSNLNFFQSAQSDTSVPSRSSPSQENKRKIATESATLEKVEPPTKRPFRSPLPPPLATAEHVNVRRGHIPGTSKNAAKTTSVTGKYVFDPLTNSWKQLNVPTEAGSLQQVPFATEHVSDEKCPFASIEELASCFPVLSKKDFTLLREFQRQLKLALSAMNGLQKQVSNAQFRNNQFISLDSQPSEKPTTQNYPQQLPLYSYQPVSQYSPRSQQQVQYSPHLSHINQNVRINR